MTSKIPIPSITCPQCGMTSYNPHDIEQRYCGNCHQWHSQMQPSDDWARNVCRIGQGHACCRYLTIVGDKGWSCEKRTETGRYLDTRVEAKTITARGDNCPGLASVSPEANFEGTLEDLMKGAPKHGR